MHLCLAVAQYVAYLQVIFLFGSLGCILLWIAKSKGYFSLPHIEKRNQPVHFKTLLTVFAIYLGMTTLIAPVMVHLIQASYHLFSHAHMPVAVLGWIQLFTLLGI